MKPYVFSMYLSICLYKILLMMRVNIFLHAFVISKRGLSFRELVLNQLVITESTTSGNGYNISVFTAALKRCRIFCHFLYAVLDDEATLTGNRVLLSNESLCSYGNKFFPISGDPSKKKRRQTPTQFLSLKVYIFILRLLIWLI